MPPAIDVDQYNPEAEDDLSAAGEGELDEPEQVTDDDLPPWDDEPAQQEIFADAVEPRVLSVRDVTSSSRHQQLVAGADRGIQHQNLRQGTLRRLPKKGC